MDNDPLGEVKRRVYLVSLLAGLPAIFLLWVTSEPAGPSVRTAFPLFALLCLACTWTVWRRLIPIRVIERTVFVAATGFAFAQLIYSLYASTDLAEARTTITEVTYLTLTALYVAAYLVFDSRTALRVSLTLYAAELAIILVKVLSEAPSGLSVEEVSWLIRTHAFMGAVIALIYASSYVKNQLLQQRAVAETMHRLAHTDQLTGIANRRKLYSELHKETEEAKRYGRPLSVILFDLDNFKHVNDTHGHDRGDRALQEVARIVKPLLRIPDHFGRWGGEEFILLAPETDLRQATRLAERLRKEISGYSPDLAPDITASFGLAQYRAGESPEALVKRADEALYEAKSAGRNRVEPTT